ncbi:amyloid fiber anchoring/assembly protein TapA [Neobacillus sp. NPDC093127]|uniref:amyloid fiber anchoring/assembly protein TapA n=1 Tax=Neobacillus sp. NPDC093127 TaxID=3364296 RepID=UPI00381C1E0B
MRLKRLGEIRNKNWPFFISAQVTIIFYAFLFTFIYSLGSTNAFYSDQAETKMIIQAGTWEVATPLNEVWDKSSLVFIGSISNQEQTISARIKNKGNDMTGTVPYEIWWTEKGNPKDGIKVGDGTIPALNSEEVFILKFGNNKPGNYMFKAYQRPNHGDPNEKNKDKGNPEGVLWSKQITVSAAKPDGQPNDGEGNKQEEQPGENNSPVNEPVKEGKTQKSDLDVNQQTETIQQP